MGNKISDRAFNHAKRISKYREKHVFKIFSDPQFRFKYDDIINMDGVHKISETSKWTIWSNQPFRRNVSKSLFLRTWFVMSIRDYAEERSQIGLRNKV